MPTQLANLKLFVNKFLVLVNKIPTWLKVVLVSLTYIFLMMGIAMYADQALYDMSVTGQSSSETRSLRGIDSLRHYVTQITT